MPLDLADYPDFVLPKQVPHTKDDHFLTTSINALVTLISNLVQNNGLDTASIKKHTSFSDNNLYPKYWSVTVTHKNKLIATIDISIQPTPFSQPTFDRYTQKAIATGHNFQKAYREGDYGNTQKPFTGAITILTGTPPLTDQQFYKGFCRRMVMERLYTAFTLLVSGDILSDQGTSYPEMTSFKSFMIALAGHVATEAVKQ